MREGKFYFDNSDGRELKAKLDKATSDYRTRFGAHPSRCLAHPTATNEQTIIIGATKVEPSNSVLPNHYWLGDPIPLDEAEKRAAQTEQVFSAPSVPVVQPNVISEAIERDLWRVFTAPLALPAPRLVASVPSEAEFCPNCKRPCEKRVPVRWINSVYVRHCPECVAKAKQAQKPPRRWRACPLAYRLDGMVDGLINKSGSAETEQAKQASALPQDLVVHPHDINAEIAKLADQKRMPPPRHNPRPSHISPISHDKHPLSPSAVLERAAMMRNNLTAKMDLTEAVQYAVEHPGNPDAQLLPHDFVLIDETHQVKLAHQKIKREIIVGARLGVADPQGNEPPMRFVARPGEIREMAEQVLGKEQIAS